MPLTAIHKCSNNKYRIGKGECKFDTREAAIAAFEHWIKDKMREVIQNVISKLSH
jgi:hypothetical protein